MRTVEVEANNSEDAADKVEESLLMGSETVDLSFSGYSGFDDGEEL